LLPSPHRAFQPSGDDNPSLPNEPSRVNSPGCNRRVSKRAGADILTPTRRRRPATMRGWRSAMALTADDGAADAGSPLSCPCCSARLELRGNNGTLRLDLEAEGHAVPAAAGSMFIDPHAHMIARTTADYEAMARAGVVAVIEPAFWL